MNAIERLRRNGYILAFNLSEDPTNRWTIMEADEQVGSFMPVDVPIPRDAIVDEAAEAAAKHLLSPDDSEDEMIEANEYEFTEDGEPA